MNEKPRPQSLPPQGKSQLTRVTRLLLRARDSLHAALGTSPNYEQLEEWTGVAERTIKDWCNNKGRPTAEFMLQLLERISEREREKILASTYRLYPSLDHPRLRCDQTILSRLKTMVQQSRGLVFIQAGEDESRTFLLTAMGHAFLGLTAMPHSLIGFDAHEPDWFVPLPGVRYLHNRFKQPELLQVAQNNWPTLPDRGLSLAVFNSTGVMLADFERQIKALALRCPVIVAEAARVKPSVLKRASRGPIHLVTLSKHPENGKGIAVAIEEL